jgi:ATP-dependent exoDNAse (exonuclease V) alpha subunit
MLNKTTGKNPVSPHQPRVKKSESLTEAELIAFKNWINLQPTKQDAADALFLHRGTLLRIEGLGSGKPETIARIREVIGDTSNN